MIRSIKLTTKYSNKNKRYSLECFRKEYSLVVQKIIDHIWTHGYINKNKTNFDSQKKSWNLDINLDNEFLKQFNNGIFTQRMLQACGTQASSIIRSCTDKSRRRRHMVSSLMKNKKNTRKLQSITDKEQINAPKFNMIEPQIDSRFFDIQEIINGKYDGFISFKLFKNKIINIPFKKYKKYHEFESKGILMNSIRLGQDYASLSFALPDKEKRSEGTKLGGDQGIITVLQLSDGQSTISNKHGYDLRTIIEVLSRRKSGSKGFKKAQKHRENYINWSINQLDFSNIKQFNLENLFQVGKGKTKSKFLARFTYILIKKKLESRSENEGFVIKDVDNSFRSQRCNECGWTQKSSRNGKVFICKRCGFATDADLNASKNIEEDGLPPIPKWVRERKINRKGFYWKFDGLFCITSEENIVPLVQKILS